MVQRSYQDILLLIARDRANPDAFINNSFYRTAPFYTGALIAHSKPTITFRPTCLVMTA